MTVQGRVKQYTWLGLFKDIAVHMPGLFKDISTHGWDCLRTCKAVHVAGTVQGHRSTRGPDSSRT